MIESLKLRYDNDTVQPTAWLGDTRSRWATYVKYARECDSILELGVYTGFTTLAFLAGEPKKLLSIDITDEYVKPQLEELHQISLAQDTDFEFRCANSLHIYTEGYDLVFIDTVHTYDHTREELNRHGSRARKYIILHDVTSHEGVMAAACEFVVNNRHWQFFEHDNHGDGLLVLRRNP